MRTDGRKVGVGARRFDRRSDRRDGRRGGRGSDRERAAVHALIVADGDVPGRSALDAGWPRWDGDVELIVAADGGWDKAVALGLRPALLVGDADSLPEDRFAEVAAQGVPIERSPTAKDESDAELALLGRSPAGGDPRDDPGGAGRQALRPRSRERRPAGVAGTRGRAGGAAGCDDAGAPPARSGGGRSRGSARPPRGRGRSGLAAAARRARRRRHHIRASLPAPQRDPACGPGPRALQRPNRGRGKRLAPPSAIC